MRPPYAELGSLLSAPKERVGIEGANISSDGKILVTLFSGPDISDSKTEIRLISADTGAKTKIGCVFPAQSDFRVFDGGYGFRMDPFTQAQFSSDCRYLLIASENGVVLIWEPVTRHTHRLVESINRG